MPDATKYYLGRINLFAVVSKTVLLQFCWWLPWSSRTISWADEADPQDVGARRRAAGRRQEEVADHAALRGVHSERGAAGVVRRSGLVWLHGRLRGQAHRRRWRRRNWQRQSVGRHAAAVNIRMIDGMEN